MDKIEIYENALRTIARHALRRKMLKTPPEPEEFWAEVMERPIELVWLLEQLGNTAMDALQAGEKADG
jgi:hypothetical protein